MRNRSHRTTRTGWLATTALLIVSSACSGGGDSPDAGVAPASVGGLEVAAELPELPCERRALPPGVSKIRGLLQTLPPGERPVFTDLARQRDLGGDPRSVLPGVRAGEAFDTVLLALPEDARAFQRRIDLGLARYRFIKRVVVVPRIRLTDWVELDPVVLEVKSDEEGRHALLELDLSRFASWHGDARLQASVFAAPAKTSLRYSPPAVTLPGGVVSWLQFSLGVNDPAWDQGPVRFRLRACEGERCSCLHEEVLDPSEPAGQGWQDRMLRLDGLAGRTVELAFESELVAPGPASYLLAQWSIPDLLVESDAPRGRRLNVLLISLDTLRADHLGAYGYVRDTSPFMSGPLARRSTVFDSAVAPSTTTAPSHMSLFTSLQPSIHGVASNLREQGLPETIPTLAEVLGRAGYATGTVNEDGAITRRLGFGRGFDYYAVFQSAAITRPEGFVGDIFDAGRRFVLRHRHQPWFLFLHTYEVHFPYTPPEKYRSLFPDGDDPRHPDNQRVGGSVRTHAPVLYDREIRHTDSELRRLIESLDADGLLDDTILIVTADHGEAFFEHHYLGHGSDAHQETVHVPLFIAGPGIEAGRRIVEPVGLIDVMPTLLEWLDVPAGDARMTGRSFAGVLRGDDPEPDWQSRVIVTEAWHPTATSRSGSETIIPPTLAVRRGQYKLIRYKTEGGAHYELFDLAEDPDELHDRFAQGGSVADELRAIADSYEAESAALSQRMGLPPLRTDTPANDELDPDHLEALRALGYVE